MDETPGPDSREAAVTRDAAPAARGTALTDLPPELLARSLPAEGERRRRGLVTARAFRAVKAQHASELTIIERFAERLTRLASSAPFLVLHVVWFATWILWNTGTLGILGLEAFDPYPFGFLTMVVSLEAIFLSIFVLMSQGREAAIGELREEVMLQVNLRMEEEITKTLQLVAGLYGRLGYKVGEDAELLEMMQPLDPVAIEQELIEQIRASAERKRKEESGELPKFESTSKRG